MEWFDFRVKAAGAAALLEWATVSERSNAGFSVERSNDERPFEMLGFVPGNGDGDMLRAYTFTDIRPAAGWNYYRIQQRDWNGAYSYSPVRALWFGSAPGRLRLWPVPAQDWVQVDWSGKLDAVGSIRAPHPLRRLAGRRGAAQGWFGWLAGRRVCAGGTVGGETDVGESGEGVLNTQ